MRLASTLVHRAPLEQVAEQARLLDGLGYDSIWVPEIAGRDALVTLGLLVHEVEHAGLATGIVPLGVRSPTTLAMAAAALAEAAPGRFTLGVGAGHPEILPEGFDARALRRTGEVAAKLSALRQLLHKGRASRQDGGSPVEIQLRGVHVDVAPRIILAALRPGMVRLGMSMADGIALNWVTPGYAREVIAVGRAAAEERGRDPQALEVACYVPVCVTDDAPAARLALGRQVAAYGGLTAYGGLWDEGDYRAVRAAVEAGDPRAFDDPSWLDELSAIGDVGHVTARLAAFRDAGVTLPILAPLAVGDDRWGSLLSTWTALAPPG